MQLSKPLVLASNSPRRREIMYNAGFNFSVKVIPTDETFPNEMPAEEVPVFLAGNKAACFKETLEDEIILCADTVVIINDEIINKPKDIDDARRMLKLLSNSVHRVITGVCIMTKEESLSLADTTYVTFKTLSEWEIEYYIQKCHPFDKAGSYGVQDFIGMIGITRIEGSFYTVMGLPIHKVYEALKKYMLY
ncbi:Maf family nucleotide pyrophosphatase [Emticicia sp. BO119]|uniref:Maf family nucleotide pyrophosphatase n=1 Tax=Emticicia sp. BO119 TaxID=2757768 RepID=UPI0015F0ECB9|nr:Maf family nucleotide pyrophosphatase [Emticicia sp. BO119]MBA4849845.1 septum formation protein Maf [Emticicia sp. BO119]